MAITILTWDRDSVLLQERVQLPPEFLVSPNWYNPLLGAFAAVRHARFYRTLPISQIEEYLRSNENLRISTVIGHSPLLSEADKRNIESRRISKSALIQKQRIRVDGVDYIDEFGFYVYIRCRVTTSPDIDLRYTQETLDPELFTIQ